MNASSPRDPLNQARMRCGDPLATADHLRSLAMDESEPFPSWPPPPSAPLDHLEGSRKIQGTDSALEAAAQWRASGRSNSRLAGFAN